MKRTTVALAGLGARGYDTYAKYQHLFPDTMEIVAISDIDSRKVEAAKKEFGIKPQMCFSSAEEMFSKGKLADCVFITTQDRQHLGHTVMALDAGYDILLEKPVSTALSDCLEIERRAQEANKLVLVCHVLRYTMFYKTIKKAVESGEIGDIVSIQAIENVGYWHHAHSFVRGNWRNENETSSMILQKCCHDFDIISWIIGKRCLSVSSFGSLKFFKEQNAPKGSTPYCADCAQKDSCAYSAHKIYLDHEKIGLRSGNTAWPCNIIVPDPTEQKLIEALKTSPYGRCVFRCDNTVVDHQVVNMLFEDEITVNFTMCAFTSANSRNIKIMGTKGDIIADMDKNIISVNSFGKDSVVFDVNTMTDDLSGHGGGDNAMLTVFFEALNSGSTDSSTTIGNSIHSHLIAFAAEKSRLEDGKVVQIKQLY